MKFLLVIDMQEDYVGMNRNQKRYPYNTETLITDINKRISEYKPEEVIYITNQFFYEPKKTQKQLVKGLKVVSKNLFMKRRGNSFTNKNLVEYLKKQGATDLELVGVDGNYCVGATAYAGCKEFSIIINEKCIGIAKHSKYKKTKDYLLKAGVQFS